MDSGLRRRLAEVRELELVARRQVTSLLAGNYLTSIRGRGLEFHEARRYVQGEPIRHIDWKMSARMAAPFVKVFLEERQREVFLALDVSPSMATGWQGRSKLEAAVELAAALAVAAIEGGDRLGWLTFSERVHVLRRPRPGRRTLAAALDELVAIGRQPARPCDVSDPRAAVHAIQQLRGRRFVVFLISDFIDHDLPDDLRYVKRRHDLSLIHVYDPLEMARTDLVRLPATAAEGDDSAPAVMRPGETGDLDELQAFLGDVAGRHGLAWGSYSTRDPAGPWLTRFFRGRRRRLEQ